MPPRLRRLAAGRARALGLPTRGTTNPNRLRRVDRWITGTVELAALLRNCADPLVVDLGYGASPITTVEMRDRLRRVRGDVRVLGLELDPDRVAAAAHAIDPPGLDFRRGGFELAGTHPILLRAFNVLRQYTRTGRGRPRGRRCSPASPPAACSSRAPATRSAGAAAGSPWTPTVRAA